MAKKQPARRQPASSSRVPQAGTQSFSKGMIKDIHESIQPTTNWTHARNVANHSSDGDLGVIGNEPANLRCAEVPYTIIGCIHKYGDEWIIYSTDNSNSEIDVSSAVKIESIAHGSNLALSADATIEFGIGGGDAATDYSGIIIKFGSGSTTQGSVSYYKAGTGQWSLADANNTAAHISGLLAFAIGTDPDSHGMMLQGIATLEGHGFSVGVPLYVSTTPGAMTTTAPSSSGDYVRIVGYAIDADTIYFDPDKTWIERS